MREEDLDLLVDAMNKESRIRRDKNKEQLKKIKTEQTKFLNKCENLVKQFITIPEGVDTKKPLDKAYQLFESFVLKLQAQLQERTEEQAEEATILLRNQYTTFSAAHNLLKEHINESITTEEVLRKLS